MGITKAPYIGMEIGTQAIALMKRIKALFDPNGILNPGKIFYANDLNAVGGRKSSGD